MMTGVVMLVLLVAGAATQTLFPALAFLGQAKPPFLLALVLYYALNRTPNTALLAALLAGVLHDLLSAVPLGYSSLVFVGVALLVGRFRNMVLTESRVTAGFFGVVSLLLAQVVLYAMLAYRGAVWWPVGRLIVRLLVGAAMAAAVTPLTFFAARRFDEWIGNLEVREVIDGIEQPIRR